MLEPSACLSSEERARIIQKLAVAKQRFEVSTKEAAAGIYGFPLRASDRARGRNHWAVSNFVDHNLAYPDQLRDYQGGTHTYDTESGYNHRGTDYFLWPFGFWMMANDEVEVVAVAPGVILAKDEGHDDQSCRPNSNPWNAVYILHDDGTETWYGHLKRGSLTTKGAGERVEEGTYLGIVGSSGNSTGPHLHFEVRKDGQLQDPYAGPGNLLNKFSLWREQTSYRQSGILKIMTHGSVPSTSGCPDKVNPAVKNVFLRGDQVLIGSYLREVVPGLEYEMKVFNPSGEILREERHPLSIDGTVIGFISALDFPPTAESGVHRVECSLGNGAPLVHHFWYGDLAEPSLVASIDSPVITKGQAITLRWDTENIYEVFLDQGLGYQPLDGSVTVTPQTSTTYTLTAQAATGEITYQYHVKLKEDPTYILPHLALANGDFTTEISVYNRTGASQQLRFIPYDHAGNAFDTVMHQLPAGHATRYFQRDELVPDGATHCVVQSEQEVDLIVAYTAVGPGSPAQVPIKQALAKTYRLHTGNWDYVWDGLAVVNGGSEPASFTLTQLNADGEELARVSPDELQHLAVFAKGLVVLGEHFQPVAQSSFLIVADQPFALTALRGNLGGTGPSFLWENAAVP